MSVRVRVEMDHAGVGATLVGPEVTGLTEQTAATVLGRLGPGFAARTILLSYGGSPRYGVVIYTETSEARLRQARDRVMQSALGEVG